MLRFIFGNLWHFIGVVSFLLFLMEAVTQVVIPVLTNRPLFPILSRQPKLARGIRSVNEEEDEYALQKELEVRRARLSSKKAPPRPEQVRPTTPDISDRWISKPKPKKYINKK